MIGDALKHCCGGNHMSALFVLGKGKKTSSNPLQLFISLVYDTSSNVIMNMINFLFSLFSHFTLVQLIHKLFWKGVDSSCIWESESEQVCSCKIGCGSMWKSQSCVHWCHTGRIERSPEGGVLLCMMIQVTLLFYKLCWLMHLVGQKWVQDTTSFLLDGNSEWVHFGCFGRFWKQVRSIYTIKLCLYGG